MPKLSAAERLARMSGKHRLEPTVEDIIIDLEGARLDLEKKLARKPRPPQEEINVAQGLVIEFKSRFKAVSGNKFVDIPAMKPGQQRALADLFEATHGHRWRLTRGWRGAKGKVGNCEMHPAFWHGVTCEEVQAAAAVTILSLPENELEGEVPPSLARVTTLNRLNLSSNSIQSVPEGLLAGLPLLEVVEMRDNELFQPFGSLLFPAVLQHLDLSGNALQGSLPDHIFDTCSELRFLDLSQNQLVGSLPLNLGQARELRVLRLRNNSFTGPLPQSMAQLGDLRELDLSANQLTGTVASVLPTCKLLESCVLSHNQFSGELSEGFESMTRLQRLYLNCNQFTGPIPTSLGSSSRLRYLNLSNNCLSGKVPQTLTNLKRAQVLVTSGNSGLLCPMPVGLGELTKIRDLALIDGYPSQDLAAQRRFRKGAFKATRITGPAAEMNNEFSPG